jgi:hypothetical protein
MRNIWPNGIVSGAVIFVASLGYLEWTRWSHGISTGPKTELYMMVLIWRELTALLVICFVAGCLLYLITSFIFHAGRRMVRGTPSRPV